MVDSFFLLLSEAIENMEMQNGIGCVHHRTQIKWIIVFRRVSHLPKQRRIFE